MDNNNKVLSAVVSLLLRKLRDATTELADDKIAPVIKGEHIIEGKYKFRTSPSLALCEEILQELNDKLNGKDARPITIR